MKKLANVSVSEAVSPDLARARGLTEEQAKVFVSKKLAALKEHHGRGDYEQLFRFAILCQEHQANFWHNMAAKIAEIFVVVSEEEIQ